MVQVAGHRRNSYGTDHEKEQYYCVFDPSREIEPRMECSAHVQQVTAPKIDHDQRVRMAYLNQVTKHPKSAVRFVKPTME